MARTLIDGNNIISFNPTNGIIVVNGYIQLSRLLFVNNATRNIALFNFSDPNNTATVTYNSNQNTTTIDVSYNTTSMSSSDKIQVFSEDREIEMKPARTYRDPVSKFRVSTPTTLIDTDFEYGPQPTKWEAIKLINNIPTSYSSPFTENSISIQSIIVSPDSDIMVVNTTNQHNLPVGGVVEINSLSDSQYEGTFIVKTSSATSFSVKLPFKSSKSAELSTIYSNAYKGAFYTGSRVQITSATTNTGTASTLTIETPNIHGLNNETKLYLKNSRATRRFVFNVPSDVVGIGTTYYKSEITGVGNSPEPEYYAKNKIITEEIIGKSEINVLDTAINTSTGQITYNNSNQNGEIVNSGISTDDVVVYYTPAGNAPITRSGTPSSTNILNFTPFRVLSATSQSGITTFTINDSFNSTLPFIPSADGSILFGNHRFIKAYRIIEFINPSTIKFNKPVDFIVGERIIICSNFYTSDVSSANDNTVSDGVTNAYLTRYNGEYITSSYPYYEYPITAVSADKLSITVNTSSPLRSFLPRNLLTLADAVAKIWCASSVISHPLSNSLYLPPSSGFSTSKYENYQYVLYSNPDNARRLRPLNNNTTYILQQISNRPDWYRIYNAENTNDTTANWNTPINLYYELTGNGSVTEVLSGIHTITSALRIKNTNTISLPQRGGLQNNADVIYNSSVNPIGNLTPNESYKIKTEDVSLDSNRFRVSNSTGVVTLYGINYTVNSNFIDFYVYDLVDRTGYDSSASDGIRSAGIIEGNIIQVSGSNYSNPIKKNFINNSFKVIGPINNYTNEPPKDPVPPGETRRRYIYSVRAEIPTDGTFNTKTAINITVTSAPTALNNVKITSIIPLDINVSGVNGEHILSQDLDGAADDIYEVKDTSSKGFIFNTSSQIPQIIKNIASYGSSTNPINFNNVNSALIPTGNNTTSVSFVSSSNNYNWVSASGSIGYTAPVSISFKFTGNYFDYQTSAGFIEIAPNDYAGTRLNLNWGDGYVWRKYSSSIQPYSRSIGEGTAHSFSAGDIHTVTYTIDGNIIYYRNGVEIQKVFIGTGKTLKPYMSTFSYNPYSYRGEVIDISIGGRGVLFTPNVTNYLKLSSHNYADGTEVTYNVEPSNEQAILPLVNNQNYYIRVLDGDFVGLTTTVASSLDRVQPLIGFSTSGSTSANHKLTTNSIQGYLNGQGSVGVTTSSTTVTGTNTNFLADYTTGDTFRIYQLDNGTSQPGTYFESKIASIKGDKTLKLEEIPSFETSAASYFKETGLYAISDGKIAHRPFDGGVAMFSGLIPNSRVIRQTRKYFRYQSGKGIQVSMAVNFNPTYDIDSISRVGVGSTSYFNIKTKFAHKISPNSPNSLQTIIISNVSGSISQLFNSTNDHNGFPVISVVDDFNFIVDIGNQTNSNDIQGFPQYNIKNWQDASIRCGLYDDQNGFFFEYDGVTLYVVRRSATQQLSGQFQVERNTHLIFGTNSKLTSQVLVNDYIVIRGQTYKVISISNDNSLSIQPAYRGNSSSDVVISKVVDTKIPQSQWNIDRMDGTGESGYDLDISKIQMVYLDYSWYGAGSGRFGFKDQYGEVTYAHEFVHNNIFTESYFRSGNLPARYEVETFDAPLYSPSLFHWGVSVIMDGGFDDDKAYLFTADSNTLPFTNNGYSSTFSGLVTSGSDIMRDITATEYSQLVVGQELYQANYTHIQKGTTILSLTTDPASNIAGSSQRYLIKMSKPAIAGTTLPSLGTNISVNAFSGTSADIQANIPLVSIRLAPSVDNGNVGNLGFRDIINRMQLTLKSAGILTTHDCEVKLILNGQLSNEEFERVTSPSLSQIYKHKIGERVSEGITVFSFRAQGGSALVESTVVGSIGRRSLSSAEVSLEELALLGNSIIGGDGTFPDGPDILTLVVKAIDPSTISGGSPMIVTGRITWTEAQA